MAISLVAICRNGNLEMLHKYITQYNQRRRFGVFEEGLPDLLNTQTNNGWAALHYAVYQNHCDIVQVLLNNGADPNRETKDQWTPLQLAAYQGHIQSCRHLLSHSRILINKTTLARGTALHLACEQGHLSIVIQLLEKGASMIIEDQEGYIPLQLATKQEIIEILPKYMGDQQINRYRQLNDIPPPPPSFSSNIYWTNQYNINSMQVFIVVDIDKGFFLHYNSRQSYLEDCRPYYQIHLNEISDVRQVTKQSNSQPQYQLIVVSSTVTINYYEFYPEIIEQWAYFLFEGAQYVQKYFPHNYNGQSRQADNPQMPELEFIKQTSIMSNYQNEEPALINGTNEQINVQSFQFLEEIGQGSFGRIYKVKLKTTQRIYALKALQKQYLIRQKQMKYAIRECKVLRQISHPFIVKMDYAFQTQQYLYMVLEFCPNGDMSKLIDRYQKLDIETAKFYTAQLVLAIEYLHSFDIIYRDLKPENILIDSSGNLKLADFGLARKNMGKGKLAKSFCGSPAYLSPEILQQKGSDKKGDIYGIGAILFELLTGLPPYYDDDMQTLFQNILNQKLVFPLDFQPDAKDLVKQLLQRTPQQRPEFETIKQHTFFQSINWDDLYKLKIQAPFSLRNIQVSTDTIPPQPKYLNEDIEELFNS